MEYFFGIAIGFIIGIEYIPYQIKKKNPKVIKKINDLLKQNNEK